MSKAKDTKAPEGATKSPEMTVEDITKLINDGKIKNIITMAGAGISTSAGIPDFRSPDGLYATLGDKLEEYNLTHPTAIFDIAFFKENPKPFYILAKELWPKKLKPTPCHYFIRMLHDKGLLLRHFTQNIDTLERETGLSSEKIIECHGTFQTSHCLQCRREYSKEWMKEQVFSDQIPKCTVEGCSGIVKPDIVFFGEALPDNFFRGVEEDLPKCDLLIIMGTSLTVYPFAALKDRVPTSAPRLFLNLEKTSSEDWVAAMMAAMSVSDEEIEVHKDVWLLDTCDNGCYTIADQLSWKGELETLVKEEHSRIDTENVETQTLAKCDESDKKTLSKH
ncbi:unnamed protein product [Owenia fusiformis]|uniref:NAD-dependent protein deacetylase n=1 Tax=Owenia fusiformis TaxID=6347 RepID=A0A8J1XVG0_OWEFU|nr:unnamed protein product [Owenia fusiformis]